MSGQPTIFPLTPQKAALCPGVLRGAACPDVLKGSGTRVGLPVAHYSDTSFARCEETNLVLNWEKCHFMVNEGIVLGHKISERGIEVDKAKVDAIEKMPCPKDMKGIRSFLGHAGFYRRFIRHFKNF